MKAITTTGEIAGLIHSIRGHRVMLDADLARLYGVPTKRLNEQVQRNSNRFPSDFMFRLTRPEWGLLRSQIATLVPGIRGAHRKYLPLAFTEQGVAMLSGVLHSDRAVRINIAIMRAFVKLRRVLSAHKKLAKQLAIIERTLYDHGARLDAHADQIRAAFDAIRELMAAPEPTRRKIGFSTGGDS